MGVMVYVVVRGDNMHIVGRCVMRNDLVCIMVWGNAVMESGLVVRSSVVH